MSYMPSSNWYEPPCDDEDDENEMEGEEQSEPEMDPDDFDDDPVQTALDKFYDR